MHFPRFLLTVNHPPLFLTHTSFKFEPTADPTTFAPIKPAKEAPNPTWLSLSLSSAMTAAPKKPPPLPSSHHHNSASPHQFRCQDPLLDPDKENLVPVVSLNACKGKKLAVKPALRPSSLQLCMKLNEPPQPSPSSSSLLGRPKPWEPLSSSSDVWDQFSDSESAPASSWSLLYRPLPLDVGRCTCIIAKERTQDRSGMSLYTLYTNVSFLLTLSRKSWKNRGAKNSKLGEELSADNGDIH
ncbi:hypothetical protein BHE74_00001655 [Ensete ventricosum]|nr:hypothetical protein BHE74_00001655 [Ensete ventricosum]